MRWDLRSTSTNKYRVFVVVFFVFFYFNILELIYSRSLFDSQEFYVELENSMRGDLGSTASGTVSELIEEE